MADKSYAYDTALLSGGVYDLSHEQRISKLERKIAEKYKEIDQLSSQKLDKKDKFRQTNILSEIAEMEDEIRKIKKQQYKYEGNRN